MDYDLNGQRKNHQTVSINNIVYRRWKVLLTEYDMLLAKGTLMPSMLEFVAHVLRSQLPKDVFLHRPHVLWAGRSAETCR